MSMATKERHLHHKLGVEKQAPIPEIDILQLDDMLSKMHSHDKLKVAKKA